MAGAAYAGQPPWPGHDGPNCQHSVGVPACTGLPKRQALTCDCAIISCLCVQVAELRVQLIISRRNEEELARKAVSCERAAESMVSRQPCSSTIQFSSGLVAAFRALLAQALPQMICLWSCLLRWLDSAAPAALPTMACCRSLTYSCCCYQHRWRAWRHWRRSERRARSWRISWGPSWRLLGCAVHLCMESGTLHFVPPRISSAHGSA